jgi:hypothetical protein
MTFRPATVHDADHFWQWRQQAEQAPWYIGQRTTYDTHLEWFLNRLSKITLLIWESLLGTGIVRIESNGELAFDATNPRAMLEELLPYAEMYGGRLKVTVDDGDTVKQRALEQAGFVEYPVKFYAYRP